MGPAGEMGLLDDPESHLPSAGDFFEPSRV